MSRRLDVLRATIALVKLALPMAEVVGLENDEDVPTRVRAGGRVVVRAGDPGDPDVDLSPLTYNYIHRIPLEIVMSDEDTLDAAMTTIGAAIDADRTLGGLTDWLEAEAPSTQNVRADNAAAQRGALVSLLASYATLSPLS